MRQIGAVRVEPAAAIPVSATPAPAVGPVAMATAELLEKVIRDGYSGMAWDELARRMVRRALPDLERAIRSGGIYRRCTRAGAPIPRHPGLQSATYPQDIAAEAVENCLERFRTRLLPQGQWDPGRGLSLEDYFCACCLPDLANRWRWHLRRLREVAFALDAEMPGTIMQLRSDPSMEPAAVVEQRALVAEALLPMPERDQMAFVMLAAGWSPAEVAQVAGMARNTLEVRISRARKAARARRAP